MLAAIRKELGFRTVFNILGPLTNPGTPTMQLLGVYDEYLVEPLARVLVSLGIKRGMVIYGQDKLDEISLSAPTTIARSEMDGTELLLLLLRSLALNGVQRMTLRAEHRQKMQRLQRRF